jgi:hypothetical protein
MRRKEERKVGISEGGIAIVTRAITPFVAVPTSTPPPLSLIKDGRTVQQKEGGKAVIADRRPDISNRLRMCVCMYVCMHVRLSVFMGVRVYEHAYKFK